MPPEGPLTGDPITPLIEPVAPTDEPGAWKPTDASYEGRMQWPYLSESYVGSRAQNARELGQWLAGHFFGRQMHGEHGMRVEVPTPMLAGVSAVLIDFGLIVQRFTFSETTTTIDVWVY